MKFKRGKHAIVVMAVVVMLLGVIVGVVVKRVRDYKVAVGILNNPETTDEQREALFLRFRFETDKLEQFGERMSIVGAVAKLTVKVVDFTGKAVDGAAVSINFIRSNNNSPRNIVSGLSDKDGLFSAQRRTTYKSIISVEKEGYYASSVDYLWNTGADFNSVKRGRWQPWNPVVEVVLKEKRRPTIMHFRTVDVKMPAYDKPVGFDFKVGDWIAPYGKGRREDVTFELHDAYIDRSNQGVTFKMVFPGEADGVLKLPMDFFSKMPSLYEAPLDGYRGKMVSKWSLKNEKMVEDSRIKREDCLIFRFRSYKDGNGDIKGAYHAKLYGPLEHSLGVAHNRRLRFSYYLNPVPGDRNLEAAGEYP